MAGIRVNVNSAAARLAANQEMRPFIRRVTRRVLNRSTILCPVDTGRLRGSGRMRLGEGRRGPSGFVEYPVDYAAAVHDGSRPHRIRARSGKFLKFEVGGRTVFARSVWNRGTRGKPFLAMAAQEVARAEGLQFRRQGGS
jgi:hypothetical protein